MMALDLRSALPLGRQEYARKLDSFVKDALDEANIWCAWGGRWHGCSDGLEFERVLEYEPECIRVCGRLWTLEDSGQKLRPFWLEIEREISDAGATWVLYLDIIAKSERHEQNALYCRNHAEEIDWRIVVEGRAEVQDGVLVVASANVVANRLPSV